jgi:3-dehydroquinate dehydratase type I
MTDRLAVSLAPIDTEQCLEQLRALAPKIGLAEICLDMMDSFDLPLIISQSPCPLIITCRPVREGGAFQGTEQERLAILECAIDAGCAYIDVEWDSVALLRRRHHRRTQIIVSRHWHECVPFSILNELYMELKQKAEVVKFAYPAHSVTEIIPILLFMHRATSYVIGIAMNLPGRLTRLLAPCFPNSLLTYVAAAQGMATAEGQFCLDEAIEQYHLERLGLHTRVYLHLCENEADEQMVIERNKDVMPGETVHFPLRATRAEWSKLKPIFKACCPRLTLVTGDAIKR